MELHLLVLLCLYGVYRNNFTSTWTSHFYHLFWWFSTQFVKIKNCANRYYIVFRFVIPLPNPRHCAHHHVLRKFWPTFFSWQESNEGIIVLFPLQSSSKPQKHVRNCLAIHSAICGVHNLNYFWVVCVSQYSAKSFAAARIDYAMQTWDMRLKLRQSYPGVKPPAHPIYRWILKRVDLNSTPLMRLHGVCRKVFSFYLRGAVIKIAVRYSGTSRRPYTEIHTEFSLENLHFGLLFHPQPQYGL